MSEDKFVLRAVLLVILGMGVEAVPYPYGMLASAVAGGSVYLLARRFYNKHFRQ